MWLDFYSGDTYLHNRAAKFLDTLLEIRNIITRGGARIKQVSFTYRHDCQIYSDVPRVAEEEDHKMFMILKLKGVHYGKPLSTSLLVKKVNGYIVAYSTLSSKGKWLVCTDVKLTVKRGELPISEPAPFSSHYNWSKEALENDWTKVGGASLIRALDYLEKGFHQGFQSICFHICEAVRFDIMEELIQKAIYKGVEVDMIDHKETIVNWRVFSHYLVWAKYKKPGDKSINEKEETRMLQGSTKIKCGLMEFTDTKSDRFNEQVKSLLKKNLLTKRINFDDIVIPSIGKGKPEDTVAARKEIENGWDKSYDLDIWDTIRKIYSEKSVDYIKLIIYHANLIMVDNNLSRFYSDEGILYSNTPENVKRYMGHT